MNTITQIYDEHASMPLHDDVDDDSDSFVEEKNTHRERRERRTRKNKESEKSGAEICRKKRVKWNQEKIWLIIYFTMVNMFLFHANNNVAFYNPLYDEFHSFIYFVSRLSSLHVIE